MIGTGRSRLIPRVLLVGWMLIVTWSSLAPVDDVPGHAAISDKVLHTLAYVVLGTLAMVALPQARPWVLVVGATGFGLLLEVLQYFTGYRAFELADLLADAVGALVGVVVGALLVRAFGRRVTEP